MSAISSISLPPAPLPPDSLLARHIGQQDYADCYALNVPGVLDLTSFIARFYSSAAFWPERKLLALIGRGANAADIAALAAGRSQNFAAWSVEARETDQILLRDFQHRTRSWLKVEPVAGDQPATRLYFGTGVSRPDSPVFRVLMPFHRWYAQRLLRSAASAES